MIKEKIKNKKLKQSSKEWLIRQINDPYVLLAKKEGYRSRAAYKLLEIQEKFKIIKKHSIAIDLGATPGGWSQVSSKICKKVISIDLLEMDNIPNVEFIIGNFLEQENKNKINYFMSGKKADVILSDMAPSSCGIKKIDHIRIMVMLEEVFEFCKESLEKGGCLVAKIFQGGAELALLNDLKKNFQKVIHFKPKSSRKESSEMYLVAIDFKGIST